MSRTQETGPQHQCRHLVPLEEVAARIGTDAGTAMALAGDQIETTWSGLPGVSEEIAAKIVSGAALEYAANRRRQAAFEAAVRQRDADRAAHARAVEAEATPRLLAEQRRRLSAGFTEMRLPSQLTLGPEERARLAREVGTALARWDAENPAPRMDDLDA